MYMPLNQSLTAPQVKGKLTFGLVVNDGITDSPADEVTVNLTKTGVENTFQLQNGVNIYPNPSYNEFILNVNEPVSGMLTVRIYNNVGQLVSSGKQKS